VNQTIVPVPRFSASNSRPPAATAPTEPKPQQVAVVVPPQPAPVAAQPIVAAVSPAPSFSKAATDEPLKFALPSAAATAAPAGTTPAPVIAAPSDRLSGIDRLLAQADELPVPPAPRPRFERATKNADVDNARVKKADAKKTADARKAAELKKAADAKKLADAKAAADEKKAREAIGIAGTNWVQLAGGAHADRMGVEFRRLSAKSSTLKKKGGAVTAGKDYFRLLTGPFDSKADAQEFVNRLAKDGVDGFSWTRTPATIKIEKLSPK
jgi:hypothetical protein